MTEVSSDELLWLISCVADAQREGGLLMRDMIIRARREGKVTWAQAAQAVGISPETLRKVIVSGRPVCTVRQR